MYFELLASIGNLNPMQREFGNHKISRRTAWNLNIDISSCDSKKVEEKITWKCGGLKIKVILYKWSQFIMRYISISNYYSCSCWSFRQSKTQNLFTLSWKYFYKSSMTWLPKYLNFFSASDIMEAVRGHFYFYGMNSEGCMIQESYCWEVGIRTTSTIQQNSF